MNTLHHHDNFSLLRGFNLRSQQSWLMLLLIVFFALISLGQLQRTSQHTAVSGYWHEVVMLVFILFWWKHNALLHPLWKLLQQPLVALTAGWFGSTWLLGLLRYQDPLQLLLGLRLVFYTLFLFVCYSFANEYKRETLKWLPVGSLIYLNLIGLVQYIWLPDTRFLRALNWDDHYYRMVGSIFDPNFLGILLVVLTAVLTGWILDSQRRHKLWLGIALGLASLSIGFTISRASYLALGVMVAYCGWFFLLRKGLKTNWRAITALALAVMLSITGYLIAPKPGGEGVDITRTASVEARKVSLHRQVLDLDVQTTVIGRGMFWRQPSENQLSRGLLPDNLLMLFIQGGGLVGLGLAIYWIYRLGWYLQARNVYLAASLVAVLVHSQFNNTFFQVFVMLYFGTICIFLTSVENRDAVRRQ